MGYTNSFEHDRHCYRPVRRSAPARRGTAKGRAGAVKLAGLAGLVAALVGACFYAATSLTTLIEGAQATANAGPAAQSTPRSAWRAGEMPILYQEDPAWSNTTYAGDSFGETGCGPTCMTMAYIALTGKDDMTPADMGAFSESLGAASTEGTAWTFMTDGAARLGLAATELPADEASIRRAIVSGSPVICSVGPGDFTTTGHFIVLAGIDQQGRLIVRDPNSPERTAQSWDFQTVLGQCRAIWAYQAA